MTFLGQDALTHNPVEDPAKAKHQRVNADTGVRERAKESRVALGVL